MNADSLSLTVTPSTSELKRMVENPNRTWAYGRTRADVRTAKRGPTPAWKKLLEISIPGTSAESYAQPPSAARPSGPQYRAPSTASPNGNESPSSPVTCRY